MQQLGKSTYLVQQFRQLFWNTLNGPLTKESAAISVAGSSRYFSAAVAEQDDQSNTHAHSRKQVKFSKEFECSVTLVGRVLSRPENQLTGGGFNNAIGFTLAHLTANKQHSYCQVEVEDSELKQQTEGSIRLGDIIVIKGMLQPLNGQFLQVLANKMAHVGDPPQDILDLPHQLPSNLPQNYNGVNNLDSVPEDTEGKWQHMLSNPGQWWDMREENEEGTNRPAFKHKTVRDRALWINPAYTPQQYLTAIQDENHAPQRYPGWKFLMENPQEFWDNHENRKTERFPHFIHKRTGAALWYDGERAPQQIRMFYESITAQGYDGPKPTDPWEDLFENPSNWLDRRQQKGGPNHPDFVNITAREDGLRYAIWLDSCSQAKKEKLAELEEVGVTFAF